MKLSNKKQILVAGSMLVLITLCLVMLAPLITAAKSDDWEFDASKVTASSPYSGGGAGIVASSLGGPIFLALITVPGIILLSWIVLSIILIAKGKPVDEKGVKKTNPKRVAGIAMLIFPFAYPLVGYLLFRLLGKILPTEAFFISLIIIIPDEERPSYQLNQWERQSMPLKVSSDYKKLFTEFRGYFESEMKEIQDPTLSREVDILNKLILQ